MIKFFQLLDGEKVLINMYKNDVNNFIEVGPGKVLSGMAKRTIKMQIAFQLIQ